MNDLRGEAAAAAEVGGGGKRRSGSFRVVAGGCPRYPPQAWRASAGRYEADWGGERPAAGHIAANDGSGEGDAPGSAPGTALTAAAAARAAANPTGGGEAGWCKSRRSNSLIAEEVCRR